MTTTRHPAPGVARSLLQDETSEWSCWRRRRFPPAIAFRKSARASRASSRRRVSFGTAGKRPVCVGVVVIEVIDHRVNDDPRNLCSPRPVEVSNTMAAMNAIERRKVSADLIRRSQSIGEAQSCHTSSGIPGEEGAANARLSTGNLSQLRLASGHSLSEDRSRAS